MFQGCLGVAQFMRGYAPSGPCGAAGPVSESGCFSGSWSSSERLIAIALPMRRTTDLTAAVRLRDPEFGEGRRNRRPSVSSRR
jgi:hypothetical protein